jgi:hypothetical protein
VHAFSYTIDLNYVTLEAKWIVQDYWGFGVFPWSDIIENRKHDVSETGSVSVLK